MIDYGVGDVVVRVGPPHPEAPRGAIARVLEIFDYYGTLGMHCTIQPGSRWHGWEAKGWRKLPKADSGFTALIKRVVQPKKEVMPADA